VSRGGALRSRSSTPSLSTTGVRRKYTAVGSGPLDVEQRRGAGLDSRSFDGRGQEKDRDKKLGSYDDFCASKRARNAETVITGIPRSVPSSKRSVSPDTITLVRTRRSICSRLFTDQRAAVTPSC